MIEVRNLSKHFGDKVAVDNLSFTVKKGEVLGFLGPNGAGKSTTMRMITGYLPMTEGSVSIGGADVVEDELTAKSRIGYLPENAPLYNDMSVDGFLRFAAELRRVPAGQITDAVDKAIATCFLESVRHQSIDTLSKGYRHRTCLAQSIIHDPDVLILDEPTDGLDPNQKHEARELIKRMGEDKAIIFSTHILEEVEAACTRAIIIDEGRIVADGTPDELKSQAEHAGVVVARLRGLAGTGIKQELEKLSEARGLEVSESGEDYICARVDLAKGKTSEELSSAIFKMAVDKNLTVEELRIEQGRLDDVFRQVTQSDTAKG
ncbi:MAG: ATP-binding cassette domain-containing protein [Verrucomicrobiales bacterium]|nr:ATP-binding cassette domain-containing protein [Verrucomicrobiales bacterium]